MSKFFVLILTTFVLFSCWSNDETVDITKEVSSSWAELNIDNNNVNTNSWELVSTDNNNEEEVLSFIDDLLDDSLEDNNDKSDDILSIESNKIIKEDSINNKTGIPEWVKKVDSNKSYDCEKAYSKIKESTRLDNIHEFWEDYSSCYFDVSDTWCSWDNDSDKEVNIEIVMDYSKSMLSTINRVTRMGIAKDSIKTFLNTTSTDNNLWLIAYWHKWGQCVDIEVLSELWTDNRDKLLEIIESNNAKWYTPIAASLQKAWEVLSKYNDKELFENHVLLVTDWVESCKWDPLKEALKLAQKGIIVSVIWFWVNDENSKILEEITNVSHGKYYVSRTEEELKKAFEDFAVNHSCYMNKAMNALEQWLKVMSESFECNHALEMEYSMEVLEIWNLFDAPESCKKELESRTKERYELIKKKIESNEKDAEWKVNKLYDWVDDAWSKLPTGNISNDDNDILWDINDSNGFSNDELEDMDKMMDNMFDDDF